MGDETNADDAAVDAHPLRDAILRDSTYLAVGAAALLLVMAAVITKVTDASGSNFFEDVVAAMLALAGGIVLAGVVGIAVNCVLAREQAERAAQRDRADQLAERSAFVERQVVQLWALREQVIHAAVLIAAHRSAKTYGEQLRSIIDVRTKLFDVRGAVERREDVESEVFDAQVDHALRFINPLIDEYRSTYLEVSRRQRLDEAANKELAECYAESRRDHDPPEDPSDDAWAASAWAVLSDQHRFPVLAHLIAYGGLGADDFGREGSAWETTKLTIEFLDPIYIAADALRADHDDVVRARLAGRIDELEARRARATSDRATGSV